MKALPTIIERALTYGIRIYPHELNIVLAQYERNTIPDYVLVKMPEDQLRKYINGLYLCGCESAGDWTQGHRLLQELGFGVVKRDEGHRSFISLVYDVTEKRGSLMTDTNKAILQKHGEKI